MAARSPFLTETLHRPRTRMGPGDWCLAAAGLVGAEGGPRRGVSRNGSFGAPHHRSACHMPRHLQRQTCSRCRRRQAAQWSRCPENKEKGAMVDQSKQWEFCYTITLKDKHHE